MLTHLLSLVKGYLWRIRNTVLVTYALLYVTYGLVVTIISIGRFFWFVAFLRCSGIGLESCGRTGGPEDWQRILRAMGSVAEALRTLFGGPRG
jgi:hypothetical protein